MTEHKSFKRLVRARMEKTGESYTTARAMLLGAEDGDGLKDVKLATSDESIRRRTGRGWEEWFEMLDDWGAANRAHRETARWLAEQQGLHPLAWNVQAIAASYERTRGLRVVGEKDDGFAITASRTVAVPVERCSTRSSTSAGASGGCPTADSASGPPPGRGQRGSTGVTAARGSTSRSWRRARRRVPPRSSTGAWRTRLRPSG